MAAAKDNIYLYDEALADFVFDETVAAVFTDMINRSVPGYSLIVRMIALIAARYAQNGSRLYDLGSSLGAVTFLLRQLPLQDCQVIAVDNSAAMLERCRESLQAGENSENSLPIELRCEDILETEISRASVVVLNFTLQFVAPAHRAALVNKIYESLLPGGVLIVSEKISFSEQEKNSLFTDLHHRFKQANGYTELEISRKRSAIENVLIPDSIEQHESRLKQAGFDPVELWFHCFNFVSLLAVKP